jgi:DUF2075 family protein
MRLYEGSSIDFVNKSIHNEIALRLKEAFFENFHYYPSVNEIHSWQNSLRALSQVFQYSKLRDNGIILEYQLPLTSKRLDCIITGHDEKSIEHAVIIELKQWERCEPSDSPNEVITWLGGNQREVLHPSVQVGQYQTYLEDTFSTFNKDDGVRLNSCSYLHNYLPLFNDELYAEKFKEVLKLQPIFSSQEVDTFKEFLSSKLSNGGGMSVLRRIHTGEYKASKYLMDHVNKIIKEKSEYVLLDEQLIVYDKVLALAKKGLNNAKKSVVIVKGGPGTGKSVIAINVMADLLRKGLDTQYATGSKAFTETLRKKLGSRASTQFKYFNSYINAEENDIDVLIADEAHRIRHSGNSRWTKREERSDLPQIEELLKISKLSIFFIDDMQNVRPNEIGSSEYIKEAADKMGLKVYEYELEAQFRCAGSEGFVNWINNTLGLKRTANVLWDKIEGFDFQIVDSPHTLQKLINEKNEEKPNSARMAAGYCWPWSNPLADGTLVNDVKINEFEMPWEGREGFKLAKGIPPASLWPFDPNGVNQLGSIYTIQGFEFDYVGIIFGPDLVYDFDKQSWVGIKENSSDTVVKRSGDKLVELLKNTYRVLLSRGMKGCYVYFVDKDTERFVKSRIQT